MLTVNHFLAGNAAQRFMAKCKCGAIKTIGSGQCSSKREYVSGRWMEPSYYRSVLVADIKCACGKQLYFNEIRAVRNDHKCGKRCTHARGWSCECSCGGEHHGSAYAT